MSHLSKLLLYSTLFIGFSSLVYGQAGNPEVLIVSGRPADDLGFSGDNIAFMYNFALSPNGNWWVGEFELDSELDTVVLRGVGANSPQVVWAEHDPVPGFAGEEFRAVFDERPNSIDDQGNVIGLARRNLSGVNRPLVFRFDGTQLDIVATLGFDIPLSPLGYGDKFHSPNVIRGSDAAFVAENLVNAMPGEDQISLFNSGQLIGQQSGITQYSNELLADFNDGRFFTNNEFFLMEGNTNGIASANEIVVFGSIGTDGAVVLKEDTTPIILPNGEIEPSTERTNYSSQETMTGTF